MKLALFALGLACLSLVSCNRAGKLLDKAKSTVSDQAQGALEKAAEDEKWKQMPMDPRLAKLVDRTEEGVLFRRDLPFPAEVKVTVTEREPMAVRLFQQSQVSTQAVTLASVRHFSIEMQRSPGAVHFSGYKEEFFDNKPVAGDAGPMPDKDHPLLAPVPVKNHTLLFQKDKWHANSKTNFADLALAQQLGPHMPLLMQEYGLNPRSLWFGKRRIVPGKPMEISGELLPMLVAGKAKGELTITLEDVESVFGHPCGRFAIKGSYQRKAFPLVDGRLFDEEVTIQSGHIWMSVLHPLVLQYRVERIITFSVAEGSGPAIRYQGNSSPLHSIQWEAKE